MFGCPDLYMHRGFLALHTSTDPSGCCTAVISRASTRTRAQNGDLNNTLETNASSGDTSSYTISIWLHLLGLVRVGELNLPAPKTEKQSQSKYPSGYISATGDSTSPLSAEDDSLKGSNFILWHPRGRRLCVVIEGEAHIITCNWRENLQSQPITLAAAFSLLAVDSDASPVCPVTAALAVVHSLPTHIRVTSACLAAGMQLFYVSLYNGGLAKVSWHGVLQGRLNFGNERASYTLDLMAGRNVQCVSPSGSVPAEKQIEESSTADPPYIIFEPVSFAAIQSPSSDESTHRPVVDGPDPTPPTPSNARLVGYSCRLRLAVYLSECGSLSLLGFPVAPGATPVRSAPIKLTPTNSTASNYNCPTNNAMTSLVWQEACLVENEWQTLLVCVVCVDRCGPSLVTLRLQTAAHSALDEPPPCPAITLQTLSVLSLPPSDPALLSPSDAISPVCIAPLLTLGSPCVLVLQADQLRCYRCIHLAEPLFACDISGSFSHHKGLATASANCQVNGFTVAFDKIVLWAHSDGDTSTLLLAVPFLTSASAAAAHQSSVCVDECMAVDAMHGNILLYDREQQSFDVKAVSDPGGHSGEPSPEDKVDHLHAQVVEMYSDPIGCNGAWSSVPLPRVLRVQFALGGDGVAVDSALKVPYTGRYAGSSTSYLLCARSDRTALSATARPGLYGAGYIAAACTASAYMSEASGSSVPMAAGVASAGATVWLYGERTRKWRSSTFPIDEHSTAGILRMSEDTAKSSLVTIPHASSTLQSTVSGPLQQVLGCRWIGDHTLVLLTVRLCRLTKSRSREGAGSAANNGHAGSGHPPSDLVRCVEIMSRAVTTASLRRGQPQPETHLVLLLPDTAHAAQPVLDIQTNAMQNPREQYVNILVTCGEAHLGVRLLAFELCVKHVFGTSHAAAGATLDRPPSYALRMLWSAKVPGRETSFYKTGLFRDLHGNIGAIVLHESGTLHRMKISTPSETANPAHVLKWDVFPGTYTDVCRMDSRMFLNEQSATHSFSASADTFPALAAPTLLGHTDAPSALLLCPAVSESSTTVRPQATLLWLPMHSAEPYTMPMSQVFEGIVFPLPISAAAISGRAVLPLGLSVAHGLLLSSSLKCKLHPFIKHDIDSHGQAFARGVLAGLPAGTLAVNAVPLGAIVLLHLARCRSTAAVRLGQAVLRALYAHPAAIAPTVDVLEETLLYLLKLKDKSFMDQMNNFGKVTSGLLTTVSTLSDDRKRGSHRAPSIDATSSAVRTVLSIASWSEKLFGPSEPKSAPRRAVSPTVHIALSSADAQPVSGLTYAVLLKFTFALDPLLFFEITSSLGRKVEPEVAKTLLPLALQSPYGPRVLRSPLSLFEECLGLGLLTYASRYLSLACEYIGGSSSFNSCLECLSLAQELLYALLLRMRLPSAIECLEFCIRFESIIDALVSPDITSRSAPSDNYKDSASASSGAVSSGTSATESIQSRSISERLYAHWQRVSPTLAHYLGAGALTTALAELDEQLYIEHTRGGLLKSRSGATLVSSDSTAGSLHQGSVFMAVIAQLGVTRSDELLGTRARRTKRRGFAEGPSLSSALVTLINEQLLDTKKIFTSSVMTLALLSSPKVKALLAAHLTGHALSKKTRVANSRGSDDVSPENQKGFIFDELLIDAVLSNFGFVDTMTASDRAKCNLGFVYLKKRCGSEAGSGAKAKPLHELLIPHACYPLETGELQLAQLLRGLVLACVLCGKLRCAALLAMLSGLPFTAAAAAELSCKDAEQAPWAVAVLQEVLINAPCNASQMVLCSIDSTQLQKAEAQAEQAGNWSQPVSNSLKMLCIALGAREACVEATSARRLVECAHHYFQEHCKM